MERKQTLKCCFPVLSDNVDICDSLNVLRSTFTLFKGHHDGAKMLHRGYSLSNAEGNSASEGGVLRSLRPRS